MTRVSRKWSKHTDFAYSSFVDVRWRWLPGAVLLGPCLITLYRTGKRIAVAQEITMTSEE